MENTIYPHIFKGLMKRQNINQLELADRSRVGIATIKRICSGKGSPKGQRPHTLKSLAKALRVKPEELIAAELPKLEEGEHLKSSVMMKASISRQTDLSYQTVEAMYGIPRSAQIEMAPLFAALIAEASLKWRLEKLGTLGAVSDKLNDIHADNPLLSSAFARVWEAEKIEKQSISERDVFGHGALKRLEETFEDALSDLDTNYLCDIDYKLPREWLSPFLVFLRDYAKSFAQADIKVEMGDHEDNPQIPSGIAEYRVGTNFIEEICGEDRWARIAIEFGHVSLSSIPKELFSPAKAKDRQDFIASQMTDDQRWAHAKSKVEEYDAVFGRNEAEDGSQTVDDERIKIMVKIIDEGRH
ncbi:helix-turn-helix transcriptional regulator [Sphingorhabdus sp.]|uniref:helix-turn-helix domain-containing protein n=1 Tax=Sphingorhabdus sp. TaxID=1902408 RepID=UPI00333FA6BE